MKINKKYIIILGTLILLLLIIFGGITYYKEKEIKVEIPEDQQGILSFSQDHPTNYVELLDFLHFCREGLFLGLEEFENKGVREVACTINQILPEYRDLYPDLYTPEDRPYIPLVFPLSNITFLRADAYINISVNPEDALERYNPFLIENDKFHYCSISEPGLSNPLFEAIGEGKYFKFDEGDITCFEVDLNNAINDIIIFAGFVPQANSISFKVYLVEEDTVSDVKAKQSFSEIKEVIKNYPIIWQIEKPIEL